MLFGEPVIINTECSKERPDLLFLGTALKIHRILQLPLHGCNKGCFIRSHGARAMLIPNVTENTFQIVRTGMTMTEVVDFLSDEYGWRRSVPNLSGKLRRGSLRYGEAVELADALGYDIVWQKRRKNDQQ